MHIEPDLRLAIALHNSPGVYALLLGSGLSSAAGILTGWQVILDLIRQLAVAQDVDLANGEETETWYRKTYDQEPDYSELLDALTSTSEERQQLLRSYFEPTDEEREEGRKAPTDAHRAIARMVRNGNVQMLLTTNFDRLLEQALQDEGIQPDVISSVHALGGAIPYIHSKVYVVKLHGDYRDPRLLNTETELSEYPDELNQFLDEIFDRFGLVVCGWSATWDIALREAILRAPNRRFTTFWLSRGEPSEEAQTVIEHRDAEVVTIESADDMFTALDEKLKSLRDLNRPHPMSTEIAVATVKRYLVEERYRVRLDDLMRTEIEAVHEAASAEREPRDSEDLPHAYLRHLGVLAAASEKLCRMGVALAWYDDGSNSAILSRAVQRLLQVPHLTGSAIQHLQRYPVLLFVYSVGIAAIQAENYEALAELMLKPAVWQRDVNMTQPAIEWLAPADILEQNWLPPPHHRNHAFGSSYLHAVVRPILGDRILDNDRYTWQFDLFDGLLALVYKDLVGGRWSPFGVYAWRWAIRRVEHPLQRFLGTPAVDDLLATGFFRGSRERLDEIMAEQEEWLQQTRQNLH
jgi:hypothetical protein